jgi:hypothetical protein
MPGVGTTKDKNHPHPSHFKSLEFLPYVVTPAKAGVQKDLKRLDTGFRRHDDLPNFRIN